MAANPGNSHIRDQSPTKPSRATPRRAESRYALIFMFLSIKSGHGTYAARAAALSQEPARILYPLPAPWLAAGSLVPATSPGVVMADVVCWPLTRRVKMPQNQGEMLHCALQITATQLEQQCRAGGAWAKVAALVAGPMSLALAFFALEDTHHANTQTGGEWRGTLVGVMPRQSDVQSRKAYVLGMESLAPPFSPTTDHVATKLGSVGREIDGLRGSFWQCWLFSRGKHIQIWQG